VLTWSDPAALAAAMTDSEVRAGLLAVAPEIATSVSEPTKEARYLRRDTAHTLGVWGETAAG